jgi:hypothetical protein
MKKNPVLIKYEEIGAKVCSIMQQMRGIFQKVVLTLFLMPCSQTGVVRAPEYKYRIM